MFVRKSTWQKFFAILCVASFLATGTASAQVLSQANADKTRDLKARNTKTLEPALAQAFEKPQAEVIKLGNGRERKATPASLGATLPGLGAKDADAIKQAIEGASQLSSRASNTTLRGFFGVPANQVSQGVILSRELVFDEGFAAALPLLRDALGAEAPIVVIATNETERQIIANVNKNLGKRQMILTAAHVKEAVQKLQNSYKTFTIRYIVAGGEVEANAYKNYGIDVVGVNKNQLGQLESRLGIDRFTEQIQAVVAASQSA